MVEVFVALAIFSYCYFYAIVLAAAVEEPILEKIEKTYDVKSGGNLTVLSEFGAIEIQTAEQETVAVVVTKESKSKLVKASQEILEDFELAFEHEGSDVHIRGTFKQGREHWQKQLNRLKIHFLITVPQQYNIDLNTTNGGISVADLTGDVRVRTSGAVCALKALQGKYGGIHPAAVLRQSMSQAMFRSELPGAASDLGQFEDLFQVELPGAASRLWIVMKG